MQDLTIFYKSLSFSISIGTPIDSVILTISSRALKYELTITVGWMSLSRKPSTAYKNSPAKIITEVVPSPTSSSYALANSIILLAAG